MTPLEGPLLLPPLRRRGDEDGADEEEGEETRAGKREDAKGSIVFDALCSRSEATKNGENGRK